MLLLISPAKTLDFTPLARNVEAGSIRFAPQTTDLITALRKLSAEDISQLMKVSEKIGLLNFERFQNWQHPDADEGAKAALFAFRGDVYTGLDADSMSDETLQNTQHRLRMLSGLYGLLKPLDAILPYRLEMGTKFATQGASNLYKYWDMQITDAINEDLAQAGFNYVVNLASNEYYKAVKPKSLNAQVITPVFKDTKNGQQKIISFYAKKARGLMARWIVESGTDTPESLQKFDIDGYCFDEQQSSIYAPVFVRAELTS